MAKKNGNSNVAQYFMIGFMMASGSAAAFMVVRAVRALVNKAIGKDLLNGVVPVETPGAAFGAASGVNTQSRMY